MRWEDERYVRLYTRDTTDWLALSFDAQGLFSLLLRKVDRAGILPLGRHGKRAVAIVVGHPGEWSRLEPALEELLSDGCVEINGDVLLMPNFLEAQEARASDKARQQKARELARDVAISQSVTQRDTASQNVTKSHAPSHGVTDSHTASHDVTPSRAVPSRTEPCRAEPPQEVGFLRDGIDAAFLELRQAPYAWSFEDERAIGSLLGKGSEDEILRRWRVALETRFPRCLGVRDLLRHWNAYATAEAAPPQKPKDVTRGRVGIQDVPPNAHEVVGEIEI